MSNSVAPGIRCLQQAGGSCCCDRNKGYRAYILILTFLVYTSYHLAKKPLSVVKNALHGNCSSKADNFSLNDTACDWKPFDKENAEELLGSLDYAFLFAYAVGMFISGHVAERMNLRYFLSVGMILTGILTALFGMGYFWNIHLLIFYLTVQIITGLFQSTGWPSVVATVGNWFGKGKRGFIMGVWNSHTSVGNILGSVIAAAFVNYAWGWSFVVPGLIIGGLGIVVFFFLVPDPEDVECSLPDHQGKQVETHNRARDLVESYNPDHDKFMEKTPFLGEEPVHRYVYSRIPNAEEEPLSSQSVNNVDNLPQEHAEHEPISLLGALKVPGVVEFSLCLFFAKLVSYTFLFWLPKYIKATTSLSSEQSGDLSTVFDFGGIFGGIIAGVISDITGGRATVCLVMLIIAAPVLFIYNAYGTVTWAFNIFLLFTCGFFVNGPYALITTAVSADLGTHKSLKGNAKALATVTAIIDGTGSMGAALGPLLTGLITQGERKDAWKDVFYMLIAADVAALLLLFRLVYREFSGWCRRREVEL
ncbi:glucose-6-phosphate exchanger SLC37A2 isoform X1 [Lingula anatina]|uniref:Sugar phosphate exchanger 3 n=1 Tax=Lingula anatina TaxID=7574 RepID=A0A1S3HG64_LINAN|nr:glucose-6-phosphate exchanger SLC37A2 isoform X1 [Lingula anatina]|eukprot:XP_013384471.1 glucose-6-phosphate exchanger SLC37A2 isoform X1 [Lingula anatina]